MKPRGAQDADYWSEWYAKNPDTISQPSSFVPYVLSKLQGLVKPGCRVVDLGCGNGRDSSAFAQLGCKVDAVDASLRLETVLKHDNITYWMSDVLSVDSKVLAEADIVYMRFFLHALTEAAQTELLGRIQQYCKPGCIVAIETRSLLDPLRLTGKQLSPCENFTDHYRRYMSPEQVQQALQTHAGCEVDSILEASGLSPHGSDDPVLIRVLATRTASSSASRAP